MFCVLFEAEHQCRGHWHKAILSELPLANRQDALIEIDILDAQVQDFPQPKTTAVQKAENLRHNEMA